jgi:hypothetical protein
MPEEVVTADVVALALLQRMPAAVVVILVEDVVALRGY